MTLEDNVLYSATDIRNKVANVIRDFFDESNFSLGQTVDYAVLANKILNITSVSRLRTVHKAKDG